MKYYVIAGEASGDLHGSNLLREIKKKDQEAEFRSWGGDLMNEQGGNVVKHIRDLAFMGFLEVLLNLRTILRNIRFCKQDILSFQPDVIVLIDYPGFNLRIAEFAHSQGIKVFYYISPQVWAWKKSRVHKIKKFVDRMFVILPFEKQFYESFGYQVDFVGHPLLDAIENHQSTSKGKDKLISEHHLEDKKSIAILPGSREQEIKKMLPVMINGLKGFEEYQWIVAAAPTIPDSYYQDLIDLKNVKLVRGKTYDILEFADAAVVTSGTATLETGLLMVPEVVCYKGNYISYLIARQLIDVSFISLVNLVMEKEVVIELIQHEMNAKEINKELTKLLRDDNYRNEMLINLNKLRENLGGVGASERTASLMISYLRD